MNVILFCGVALVLGAVGYKWFQIHRLMRSGEPTPPKFWTVTLLPIGALFLAWVVIYVWSIAELHRR